MIWIPLTIASATFVLGFWWDYSHRLRKVRRLEAERMREIVETLR